jgi:hypothetical protein
LRVVAAGAPITENTYHCAVVSAGHALAEADRINGAHWCAAKAGKAGYRRADVVPIATPTPSKPAPMPTTAGCEIPDDLNIPDFLLRRPLPPPEHPAQPDRLAA